METWTLHHPERGTIAVHSGFDAEFLERYPDWPRPDEDAETEGTDPGVDAGYRERLKAWADNPPKRLVIEVNGEPVRRYESLQNGRFPLQKYLGESLETPGTMPDRDKPYLKLTKNLFGDILDIDYREGDAVVEFDAPPGSRGEKRKQAMEESATKRLLYPMLAGLGKGGWALFALVVMPILKRILEPIIDWLLSFLPDWDMPDLPSPPQITLPTLDFPDIVLPVLQVPEFELPQAPDWVLFLLEYTKIWVPILLGIAFGVIALRNHKKSERIKREWEARGVGKPGQD